MQVISLGPFCVLNRFWVNERIAKYLGKHLSKNVTVDVEVVLLQLI